MQFDLEPGDFVVNPKNKEWGTGQIQSIIKNKITVNFQNIGKQVIFNEYPAVAIQTPWAREFFNFYHTKSEKIITGPLIFSKVKKVIDVNHIVLEKVNINEN